jgi:hypothetical protein
LVAIFANAGCLDEITFELLKLLQSKIVRINQIIRDARPTHRCGHGTLHFRPPRRIRTAPDKKVDIGMGLECRLANDPITTMSMPSRCRSRNNGSTRFWRHCEDKGARGRTITLKIKFADFELISRSRTLAGAIVSCSELENVSADLLKALFPMKKAVRLLGVSISGFSIGEIGRRPEQIALAL